MNRRDFLKYSAMTVLGMGVPLLLPASGESRAVAVEKPMIRRRFLQFTDHEERPATEFLVIHHTGYPVDKDSTVAEIHKFHREELGWAGIGYHYLISKNGLIEQGRWPSLVGAHAYHYNRTSVGICLAGNFDLAKPTRAQMKSVKRLTAWLCQEYSLDPMKSGVIVGHRDLNDTSCPGENLYSLLGDIRQFCRDSADAAARTALSR